MPRKTRSYWFSEEGLLFVYRWARRGLSDSELCELMEIDHETFAKWNKQKVFYDNLWKGRYEGPMEIEDAVYRAAKGYDYVTTKQVVNNEGEIIQLASTHHIPGSVQAQKFLLLNRLPHSYKELVVEGQDQVLSDMDKFFIAVRQAAEREPMLLKENVIEVEAND